MSIVRTPKKRERISRASEGGGGLFGRPPTSEKNTLGESRGPVTEMEEFSGVVTWPYPTRPRKNTM